MHKGKKNCQLDIVDIVVRLDVGQGGPVVLFNQKDKCWKQNSSQECATDLPWANHVSDDYVRKRLKIREEKVYGNGPSS